MEHPRIRSHHTTKPSPRDHRQRRTTSRDGPFLLLASPCWPLLPVCFTARVRECLACLPAGAVCHRDLLYRPQHARQDGRLHSRAQVSAPLPSCFLPALLCFAHVSTAQAPDSHPAGRTPHTPTSLRALAVPCPALLCYGLLWSALLCPALLCCTLPCPPQPWSAGRLASGGACARLTPAPAPCHLGAACCHLVPAAAPATTSCLRLVCRFDGGGFRWVRSGEYIQMSGRAGRRGLDDKGGRRWLPACQAWRCGAYVAVCAGAWRLRRAGSAVPPPCLLPRFTGWPFPAAHPPVRWLHAPLLRMGLADWRAAPRPLSSLGAPLRRRRGHPDDG